jgi:predicted transposase YbfD/YdcC
MFWYKSIEGAIVALDALNCQKKTAKSIVEKGRDYLLSVKKNQKLLFEEV